MKLNSSLALMLSLAVLALAAPIHSRADEHRGDDRRNEEGHGRSLPPRPEPPKYKAHPPGMHPHGPMVRPHQVRVLKPRAIQYGGHQWNHWVHPEFARPYYYWDWAAIHSVSCVSEDSYGDQYPVTENTFPGFALANMSAVEDDALDRCYSESGGDTSCFLLTCSHF